MNIAGSVHFPLDCHLTPERFMRVLREDAERRGVKLQRTWMMSRHTRRTLSLADRMAAAKVDLLFVAETQTLIRGYTAQRVTNSELWKDNMGLRAKIAELEAAKEVET